MTTDVVIVGAGLAGCEAAWQAASLGARVQLIEMKPKKRSNAHHSALFAELVCSNSLGSKALENGKGLLKQELRTMKSLIVQCADENSVPAGGALAVDRDGFAEAVTARINAHKNIHVVCEEVTEIPGVEIYIIATGPLTSENLSRAIQKKLGEESLFFFDAAAPIISAASIEDKYIFRASRYDKGDDDYINCPMNKEEYDKFVFELIHAETVEEKDFENKKLFEGCMPVESMAKRGHDTLRFGPLKPKGLIDPTTGKEAYAVIQLRQENKEATLYNLVGFQTRLKQGEQRRVFGLIPGLEHAEFFRYGMMHRNTYIKSPGILEATYARKDNQKHFFAGQITGVEGYMESTSSGLVAGINAAHVLLGKLPCVFPSITMIGALAKYISTYPGRDFQPMNANFGIIEPYPSIRKMPKKDRYEATANRAIETVESIKKQLMETIGQEFK